MAGSTARPHLPDPSWLAGEIAAHGHTVSTTSEMIALLRHKLNVLDGEAIAAGCADDDQRRGEVVNMAAPGFALPPGATQCPRANYERFGSYNSLSGGTAFTTFTSHCGLVGGKYMYEVSLITGGSLQIGFCGPMNMFLWDDKKGVGDFPFTVGYDGSTCRLINVESKTAGWKWSAGDIISVTFDLTKGIVCYYQNGKFVVSCSMPTIQSSIAAGIPHSDKDVEMCYFPAISTGPWERCGVNLGGFPFYFPIEGFMPVQPQDVAVMGSWLPRFALLDNLPSSVERYRHVIESVVMEKVMGNSEKEFLSFCSCGITHMIVLGGVSVDRSLAFVAACRRTLTEEMFQAMVLLAVTRCCGFAICSVAETWRPPPYYFDAVGVDPHSSMLWSPLTVLEYIFGSIPEAIATWPSSVTFTHDIAALAGTRMPNPADIEDIFPQLREDDVFEADGYKRLQQQQASVGRSRLAPNEGIRHRVFVSMLVHPNLRAQLAIVIHGLIDQIHVCNRDPSKRMTFPTYSEQLVVRLFFHIACAVSERCKAMDDETAAEVLCPPSVLKMRTKLPKFAGIPHDDLMVGEHAALFNKVPDIAHNSPDCLILLLCELYSLVVKGWVLGQMRGALSFKASRQKYESAAAELGDAWRHSDEGRQMHAQLRSRAYDISWLTAYLHVDGFHEHLTQFCVLLIRIISHYASSPFAPNVPVLLVECAVDLLHFTRKTCPRFADRIRMCPVVMRFMLRHFRSRVIHHHPTREYILMTMGNLIETKEVHRRQFVAAMEANFSIFIDFYADLLDLYGDNMAWTLAVNPLYRYQCGGNGFCVSSKTFSEAHQLFDEPETIPQEQFTAHYRIVELTQQYFETPSMWADKPFGSSPMAFMRNAVSHANWCVTELSSILNVIKSTGSGAVTSDVAAQRARGASVMEYTVKTLHIVEGLLAITYQCLFDTSDDHAGTVPAHKAPPISASSKALLVVELVAECLTRFTKPSTCLTEVLGMGIPEFARFEDAHVLASVVGILHSMLGPIPPAIVASVGDMKASDAMAAWRRYQAGDTTALPPTVAAYITGLVGTNVFFKQIAQPRVDWDHGSVTYALTGIDWADVCARLAGNSTLLRVLPVAGMAYEALAAKKEATSNAVGSTVEGGVDGEDDSLCAICCVTPLEVVFQPCGHRSCRACIERHQINDRRCFFCKALIEATHSVD